MLNRTIVLIILSALLGMVSPAKAQGFACKMASPIYPATASNKYRCDKGRFTKAFYETSFINGQEGGIPGRYNSAQEVITQAIALGALGSGCSFALASDPKISYLWDIKLTVLAYASSDCNGQSITIRNLSVFEGCPDGFAEHVPNTTTSPMPQGYANGYACIQVVPPRYPQCGYGNPVETFGGAKVQFEMDYEAPSGKMSVGRRYRSDSLGDYTVFGGSWTLEGYHSLDMEQQVQGSVTLWLGNGLSKHFFSTDGKNWTTEAYDSDRLVMSVDSAGAVAGWLYYSVDNLSISKFSASGVMTGTYFIDGSGLMYGLPTSLADSFGRALSITSDEDGLISSVTLPDGGVIKYSYAKGQTFTTSDVADFSSPASKNLTSVQFADGASKTYVYGEAANIANKQASEANSLLTGVVDENSDRFATFGYSMVNSDVYTQTREAKAISTEHAGGVFKFGFSRVSEQAGGGGVVVSEPAINDGVAPSINVGSTQSSAGSFQKRILESSKSQPAGSGCSASASAQTYDANGNPASHDDFNGNRACYAYDLTRNLRTVALEGLSTTKACPTTLASYAPSAADAAHPERKTTTTWHPDWPLKVREAEPEKLTTWVYNGQPDPVSGGTASCAPSTATLPDGKPIAVLCARYEQATTDLTGALGTAATVTGAARRWSYTYNAFGQVLTETTPNRSSTDTLSHTTTYTYYAATSFSGAAGHTLGDLQTVTNPLGQVTAYTSYDKAGRLLSSTDANGTVTTRSYTPRGWLQTQTVTPTSGTALTTTYAYWPTGLLKTATMPDASTLNYTYDAAHRLTDVEDAAGNKVHYVLDNMGNRTGEQTSDASGSLARSIARVYDNLNRLQTVTGAMQ